ncbi:MAG: hypothetical protein A3I75_03330 [Deltaproteobacteria bacterium RIFCSPLOWO2_02_FULL_50_16]|nr:MAG: hypothetical protein A2053_06755 [Deltaproteobacteria bacterium GWA2_50_8]OGQ26644.1 MAG: hypothetical protein A3B79_05935 [Deltaproteobacteria bacterium RIFCSPHIGHO2_02_FULL_50_15]OGQ57760.1 MAG: hypothetical protein A3I75_03330 [Deltaproteobacteria bacterium RIFCSPLOWO2_02_FULL_50_16]OGQ68779.1 MAG: hypothetical protein A3F89_07350 [Deltaproteobacteria bacterium RIFCSPLOWO2_12_FULL_50_11]
MPRFLIEAKYIINDQVAIKGPDVRHIKNVLRLKKGDALSMTDGAGIVYEGIIDSMQTQGITVKITSQKSLSTLPIQLCCAQALIKKDKMDWVIQKTVELGVSHIIPFTSSRTVPQGKENSRRERWKRIAQEAMKQSGQTYTPTLAPPLSFDKLLHASQQYDLKILCWENEASHSLKRILRNPDRDLSIIKSIIYIIGPEGGFTPDEIQKAIRSHFIPISLGDRILRSETASVTVASILQYEANTLLPPPS